MKTVRFLFFLVLAGSLTCDVQGCSLKMTKNLTGDVFDLNLLPPPKPNTTSIKINFMEYYTCTTLNEMEQTYIAETNTYLMLWKLCDPNCQMAEIIFDTKNLEPMTLANGLHLQIGTWKLTLNNTDYITHENAQTHSSQLMGHDDYHLTISSDLQEIIYILVPLVLFTIVWMILFKYSPFYRFRAHRPVSRPDTPMVTECKYRLNYMNEQVSLV